MEPLHHKRVLCRISHREFYRKNLSQIVLGVILYVGFRVDLSKGVLSGTFIEVNTRNQKGFPAGTSC